MKHVLIIGGAGFIGCNTAEFYLRKGCTVEIFDNFSRQGAEINYRYLKELYSDKVLLAKGDIRTDYELLKSSITRSDVVFHLAAQVAVTTSVVNPREDFEINALGTFNVLEALRESKSTAPLIYASTNKVYGGMEDAEIIEVNGRYQYKDIIYGVSEDQNLDFHSPYGCSKGAGDQYVRDYSRIYGLRTVVFRQSCIYGYHQFGVEDQGWVAWFAIAAALNKPITIYGDGQQVRDVLFIDDLISCYDSAIQKIDSVSGRIYNIGGGPENTLSLLELISLLEDFQGKKISYSFSNWRPGDQRVFICDIKKAHAELGWMPTTAISDGVKKLTSWIQHNVKTFI